MHKFVPTATTIHILLQEQSVYGRDTIEKSLFDKGS